jgi:hypothetical protein
MILGPENKRPVYLAQGAGRGRHGWSCVVLKRDAQRDQWAAGRNSRASHVRVRGAERRRCAMRNTRLSSSAFVPNLHLP